MVNGEIRIENLRVDLITNCQEYLILETKACQGTRVGSVLLSQLTWLFLVRSDFASQLGVAKSNKKSGRGVRIVAIDLAFFKTQKPTV
jgi:hypothetical protein